VGKPHASPLEVVRHLGAVQAQDYGGAKWAVAQRTRRATEAELDRLYDEGAILRTHVLRPTWHFVLPEDIRWLLELTGPRIRQGLSGRLRQLGIDEATVAGASNAFARALAGGRHLTRVQLDSVLRAAGIAPDGQRLPNLLMCAELDGLIVSGSRQENQHSYALLEERVPQSRPLPRSEAALQLVTRYFRSRGPAQLQDFVWWSGLTALDVRSTIARAGTALQREMVDGSEYFAAAGIRNLRLTGTSAHLLPNFDEYTVAYRHRAAIMDAERRFDASLFSFGSVLSNVVVLDGTVRGAWRRTVTPRHVEVELRLLGPLQSAELAAVEKAADRLSRFLERPVVVKEGRR
jgi:hypothetical protein